jgi:hypothetical protein
LVLIALACVLAAVPAVSAPDRDRVDGPAAERPEATDDVRDAVISLWEWLRQLLVGDETTKGDQMPGSGLDPDGHKPPRA